MRMKQKIIIIKVLVEIGTPTRYFQIVKEKIIIHYIITKLLKQINIQ